MNEDVSPDLPEIVKPDREATFLRLLVDAPTGEHEHEVLLRRLVWRALGLDARGRPWRVGRMFAPVGRDVDAHPTLTRFYEVTGEVVATPAYPPSRRLASSWPTA
jgi:hypothetical protein